MLVLGPQVVFWKLLPRSYCARAGWDCRNAEQQCSQARNQVLMKRHRQFLFGKHPAELALCALPPDDAAHSRRLLIAISRPMTTSTGTVIAALQADRSTGSCHFVTPGSCADGLG